MKTHTMLFDAEEAQKTKKEGMERAAGNNRYHLDLARFAAEQLAARHPDKEVTADDVAIHLKDVGAYYGGSWTGSIFKGKKWEFTGTWVKSRRVSNHARMIRVWRFVG